MNKSSEDRKITLSKNEPKYTVQEFNNTDNNKKENEKKIKITTIETSKNHLKKPEKLLSSVDLKTLSYYNKNIKKFESTKGEKKEPYVVYLNSKIDAVIEKNRKKKLGKKVGIILCGIGLISLTMVVGYKLVNFI